MISEYNHGECMFQYDDELWMALKGWVTKEDAQDSLIQEVGNGGLVGDIEHVYVRFGFRSVDGERMLGFTECSKGRGATKVTRVAFSYI